MDIVTQPSCTYAVFCSNVYSVNYNYVHIYIYVCVYAMWMICGCYGNYNFEFLAMFALKNLNIVLMSFLHLIFLVLKEIRTKETLWSSSFNIHCQWLHRFIWIYNHWNKCRHSYYNVHIRLNNHTCIWIAMPCYVVKN